MSNEEEIKKQYWENIRKKQGFKNTMEFLRDGDKRSYSNERCPRCGSICLTKLGISNKTRKQITVKFVCGECNNTFSIIQPL